MSAAGAVLCRLEDLDDGAARGFTIQSLGERCEIFVMRRGDAVLAYVNACPHVGTPVDWAPDRFLSPDGNHFQCSTHGALFRLDDGYCIAGPCAGKRLQAVAASVVDGCVFVAG